MDPITGLLIFGIVSSALGAGSKAAMEIRDYVKKNKKGKEEASKYSEIPDKKNYPEKTNITKQTDATGKVSYWIYEPNKPGYEYKPKVSPIPFSDDTIKQIDNLPPDERKLVNTVIGIMQSDPDGFLQSINKVDPKKLEEVAQGKMPTAEELGFPPNTNLIDELMKSTDFAPIEEQARRQFSEQTIPKLAEQFAGAGGLNSTALKGELGRAGSDLESKLAALKSQYGLQRASALGGLSQKQQALDVGRAQAIGNLGLAQQGQQFGQQQALANLGLQQNQQQLGQQAQRANLLSSLLGHGQYGVTGQPPQGGGGAGAADYAIGAGASALGLGLQGYMQQQSQQNLLEQLKLLNPGK